MKVKAVKPPKTVVSHEAFAPKKLAISGATVKKDTPQTTEPNPNDIMNLSVKQLWTRIKSSVNDLQAASLTGRDLARHRQQQLVHLGARPLAREVIPSTILRGQREKAKKRHRNEVTKKQEQREHVFETEQFGKKFVQNKAIYGLRPAEERKVKEKKERLRRHRK